MRKIRSNAAYELAIERLAQLLPDNNQQDMLQLGQSLLEWVFCKKDTRPFRILVSQNADAVKRLVKIVAEYGLRQEYGESYRSQIDPAILLRLTTDAM